MNDDVKPSYSIKESCMSELCELIRMNQTLQLTMK